MRNVLKILAALSVLAGPVTPAVAGSMANSVKVIVVSPSAKHQALSVERQIIRERKREARQAERALERENRELRREEIRRKRDADKAYEKKLAAQRKARKKRK